MTGMGDGRTKLDPSTFQLRTSQHRCGARCKSLAHCNVPLLDCVTQYILASPRSQCRVTL